MGFYGLLVGMSLLVSLSGLLVLAHQASQIAGIAYQYSEYNNIVTLSAFAHAAYQTAPTTPAGPAYSSWFQSLRASGYQDGIDVRPLNGAVAISTTSRPYEVEIIRINNT
ncbi:MAG: hypothetical protein KGH66_01240 [Candidatus Micrarchaeota archaeon]|nr:hypothetical protein [Candidatus Micrarchaeota archaeon]